MVKEAWLPRQMRLYNKLWSYKDHGKTLEAIRKTNKGNSFKWLHEELGSNFRLTEMQSNRKDST